jgi:hypothetical protein
MICNHSYFFFLLCLNIWMADAKAINLGSAGAEAVARCLIPAHAAVSEAAVLTINPEFGARPTQLSAHGRLRSDLVANQINEPGQNWL